MVGPSNWLVELLALSALVILQVNGSTVNPHDIQTKNLVPRAMPDSPRGYQPVRVPCPQDGGKIREANELSPQEKEWLQKRRKNVVAPMKDLLSRLKINGFDSNKYMQQIQGKTELLPNIGIAFSGGGYRAMLTGAGVFAAFDDRTPGSKDPGNLGGLLQATTYVSGLSGGAWLVGSVYTNNFTPVHDIIADSNKGLWEFDRSLLEGPKHRRSIPLVGIVDYIKELIESVISKKDAHFDISITDFWSRALSYPLINIKNGGAAYTYSSIAEQPDFPEGKMPMPFIVADVRNPGQILVSRNTTVVEFGPYEMGSWDPALFGMAPLKYVGSRFEGGKVVNNECFNGLDNAGFVMGTSSSLFNTPAIGLVDSAPSIAIAPIKKLMEELAKKLSGADNDIASWTPNPFFGWRDGHYTGSKSKKLSLADGGLDFQNIPLYPLIQPQRQVDVLFAVDSSGDSGNGSGWPNGTSLIATYERSRHAAIANGTSFPAVPDTQTFVNLGLLDKPSFFGCDPKNTTNPTPLIVYLPNHPYTYWANITTFTGSMSNEERNDMIRNGYNMATMGNASVDEKWPQCVGCAILSRSFDRSKTAVPQACQDCFKRHCWNGTVDSRPVKHNPPMVNPKGTAQFKRRSAAVETRPSLVAVLGAALLMVVMGL